MATAELTFAIKWWSSISDVNDFVPGERGGYPWPNNLKRTRCAKVEADLLERFVATTITRRAVAAE